MAFHARTHLVTMLALRTDCIAVNVRRMMSRLLPQGNCSIEAVARQLGVDRRTVHRKLRSSGESYSANLSDMRMTLTLRYTANPHRPLCEVAELVGFESSSSFSRWFPKCFGCSASEWRLRHAEAGDFAAG
ncbi:helix-turn-helix transcriptional regulator [Cupriavidus taiwanensis]|uniref:Helix-turn-helix, Fis-type n=1 Tax=Cupriavidus taiwanensis TaxID=164546 RepID=A0A375JAL2_9BURK